MNYEPADLIWSLLVLPALVVLFCVAVTQVVRHNAVSRAAKVVLVAVLAVLPVIGPIAWFVLQPKRLEESVPQSRAAQ